MNELKEIQFANDTIVLDNNMVRGAILPKNLSEMDRDVIFQKDTVVEGAVYAHKIEVRNGDIDVRGAAFPENLFRRAPRSLFRNSLLRCV